MLHKTPQLSREASHQSSRVKNSDNHARNEGSVCIMDIIKNKELAIN